MRRRGSWDFRSQYGRLSLIANSSRFLTLPGWSQPNIGSRVLSLTDRRVAGDWPTRFGHPLLLLETVVAPQRFNGGGYRAANWMELGRTQRYRRTKDGCSAQADGPKRVFLRPLCGDARTQQTHAFGTREAWTSPARQNFTTDRPRLRCLSDEHGRVALGLAARAKRRYLNLFNDLRACGTDEEGPARRHATRYGQFVIWSSLFEQRRSLSGGRRGLRRSRSSANDRSRRCLRVTEHARRVLVKGRNLGFGLLPAGHRRGAWVWCRLGILSVSPSAFVPHAWPSVVACWPKQAFGVDDIVFPAKRIWQTRLPARMVTCPLPHPLHPVLFLVMDTLSERSWSSYR